MQINDFIEIEYVGKVALTGEVFDVTSADYAKEAGEFNEKAKYEPALVVMGANMTIKGVEKQLETMNVGEEREFNVMPDEAFGKRLPELVKIMSMKDFIKQKINPVPGIFVTIDGRQAKIQSISGGRVRVDFNHPLAGRELIYKMKVVRQITYPAEKVQKYLAHFGMETKCAFSDGKLNVKTDEKLKSLIEKMFSEKIKKLVPEIREIAFEAEKGKPENETAEKAHENHDHAGHAHEEAQK